MSKTKASHNCVFFFLITPLNDSYYDDVTKKTYKVNTAFKVVITISY